jgi:hypothetical protein
MPHSEFDEGEALQAAHAAFAEHGTEVAAFTAYSERCDRAVADFLAGNLTTSQFRVFLLRNGYTTQQADDEISQRVEEKGLPTVNLTPNID